MDKEYNIPDYLRSDSPQNLNLSIPQNFQFGIVRLPNFSYFVQSVALGEMSASPKTAPYAIGPTLIMPASAKRISSFIVSFLVSENFQNYFEIINWMREATPYRDFTEVLPLNNVWHEGFLLFLSNKKNPYKKITFRGLFPVEISGLEFVYSDTDFRPLLATAKFAVNDYIIENL